MAKKTIIKSCDVCKGKKTDQKAATVAGIGAIIMFIVLLIGLNTNINSAIAGGLTGTAISIYNLYKANNKVCDGCQGTGRQEIVEITED